VILRAARAAVTAAVVTATAAAVGCSSSSSSPVPRPPFAISTAQARSLLLDSWVSDGTRGFFVDGALSPSQPAFSLYDTRWELMLAGRSGRGTAGLSRSSVAGWIGGALDGRMGASGLPVIGQLDYAVAILSLVKAPVDRAEVATTLGRLLSDGRYRADTRVPAPDWGSTAIAVGIETQLGLPVPAQVVARARAALAALSPRSVTAASVIDTVSLLQIAAALDARHVVTVPAAHLAGLVSAAEAGLSPAPPGAGATAAWLAAQVSLRAAAARLHAPLPALKPSSCQGILDSSGAVRLPGQPMADPQATLDAATLGCRGVRPPPIPAHSRAGWPSAQAVADSLAASTAAARAARTVGVLDRYAASLRNQISTVWLPALRRSGPSQTATNEVDRTNLEVLSVVLGKPPTGPLARPAPLPAAGSAAAGNDIAILVALTELAYSAPTAAELVAARSAVNRLVNRPRAAPSIVHAAWLELAARVFSEPLLHRRAAAEAAQLQITPGVYAAGHPASTASLTASTIGTWIRGDPGDLLGRWSRAGLCNWARCAETHQALASLDYLPMKTLAAVLAAASGKVGELFPIAF
jgi:hypothetical protein